VGVAQDAANKHGGSYSVKLTRTVDDNAATQFTSAVSAVVAASTYKVSFWFLDNDATARANVSYQWFDAAGVAVGAAVYGSAYTTDMATWQELTVTTAAAPATAVSIKVFTRIYAVGTVKTGGFVNLDDATITKQ